MLKRGHVYKVYFKVKCLRDYMIFSPQMDVTREMFNRSLIITPIFHVNLNGDFNYYGNMGLGNALKIEKPNTEQDFNDIEYAMRRYNMSYNRALNRLEP